MLKQGCHSQERSASSKSSGRDGSGSSAECFGVTGLDTPDPNYKGAMGGRRKVHFLETLPSPRSDADESGKSPMTKPLHRLKANANERRRMQVINDSFERLISVIRISSPGALDQNRKLSKAEILEQAAFTIVNLRNETANLRFEKGLLMKHISHTPTNQDQNQNQRKIPGSPQSEVSDIENPSLGFIEETVVTSPLPRTHVEAPGPSKPGRKRKSTNSKEQTKKIRRTKSKPKVSTIHIAEAVVVEEKQPESEPEPEVSIVGELMKEQLLLVSFEENPVLQGQPGQDELKDSTGARASLTEGTSEVSMVEDHKYTYSSNSNSPMASIATQSLGCYTVRQHNLDTLISAIRAVDGDHLFTDDHDMPQRSFELIQIDSD